MRVVILLAFLLPILALAQVSLGAVHIPMRSVIAALIQPEGDFLATIVRQQRLPRVGVAIFVGACLGVSGLILQKVMQNVLVSPSTLGINAGATLAVVLSVFFLGLDGRSLFLPGLLGGIAAMALTLMAARLIAGQGDRRLDVVLAGSMVGILCSSASTFVMTLDSDAFGTMIGWLVGDIGNFDHLMLPMVALPAGAALAGAFLFSRHLDVMVTGDDQAALLGVDVRRVQALAVGIAVVLAVSAVVVVGPIGFLGLVVPHLVKLALGETGRATLLAAMLAGPCILMLADIAARVAVAPRVLPVGIVMGLAGGVLFLGMVLSMTRRGRA
ncbi:iron ABC transporter permease [Cereibacter sp. SYSU M97828]|nr:iron ABC transporter permease [Cereibacter flavus]